jgi:UDP-N-acetylmuramoyl-L-alanyl-D-glutamate--2,6-diaminopimelate ligase
MSRWFVDRSPHRGIPAVSLRQLLPEAQFIGCPELEVSGCTADSRRLEPGQVFVAVQGTRHDGHQFVSRALERGAAGVIVERPCPEAGRLQVVVPNSRVALARLCHALAGNPSERLRVIGVAGRFGKTATAHFLRSIFERAGQRFGQVGPEGWSDGVERHPASSAPLAPESLAAMLAAMVERRCAGAVVEVNDATLAQRGVEAARIDTAVITGFEGELLNEPDEELVASRGRAARLFRALGPGSTAVVNADDPHAELLGASSLHARRVTFALDHPADVTARVERLDGSGSRVRLVGFKREVAVRLHAIGTHHVRCALAAAAAAWARGVPADLVVEGLQAVKLVPGRLEPLREGQLFDVWVDSARTPSALRLSLCAAREACRGRITCVVGAEGRADRSVRVALAQVAEANADLLILTTNNPRTDDPAHILTDLLAGLPRPAHVIVEPDRHRAIELALASASPGDAVVIAGKGRDAYQILADRAIPFDDREVATRCLRQHQAARRTSA